MESSSTKVDIQNSCIAREPTPGSFLLRFHTEPTSVPSALRSNGEVQFFVNMLMGPDAAQHRHRSFELATNPCGTWIGGQPGSMSAVDAELDGWLPASHAVFNGKAPADAKLGYNPKFLLEGAWPLSFVDKASLSWQRYVSSSDDPLRSMVPSEFYRIDDTTIWWMTNESRYLPWDYLDTYEHGERMAGEPQSYKQRLWLDLLDTAHGRQDRMVSSLCVPPGMPDLLGDLNFHRRTDIIQLIDLDVCKLYPCPKEIPCLVSHGSERLSVFSFSRRRFWRKKIKRRPLLCLIRQSRIATSVSF